MNIFTGSENSLEVSQFYHAAYACDFNLAMFPFDAQVNIAIVKVRHLSDINIF